MFKKMIPAFVAGALLVGTPVMSFAEYEYGNNDKNELLVISKDHVAYVYMTYDNNGNLVDWEYCQAPSGVSTTYDASTGFGLTWSPVPGAVAYRVYQNGTPLPTNYTTTSATVGNLSSGSPYSFYVTAIFADGVSESAASSTVTVLQAPTFTGNSTTASSVTLTWGSVTNATGYKVYQDGVQVQTTTNTTITLQNLLHNHTYNFQVSAFNSQSDGIRASETVATDAPPVLSTSNLSASGVTLSWSSLASATSYNVYMNGSKIASGITGTTYAYTGTLNSAVVTNFTVSAVYSTGEGDQSAPATLLPATTITSGTTTNTTATVNWNAVSGATGYTIKLVPTSGTTVTQTVTGTSATISNLTPGTTYNVTVSPLSGTNQGFASPAYSLSTVNSYTVPYGITVAFGTVRAPATLGSTSYSGITTVSWHAPSNADSTTKYTVYQTDSSGKVLSTLASGITSTSTQLSIAEGTTMSIAVGSVTEGVNNGNSAVYTFTTPYSTGGAQL